MEMVGRIVLGKYEIVRRLGKSGICVVWEAWDRINDRDVLIKQFKVGKELPGISEDMLLQRFLREAQAAVRILSHPNIAAVFEFGEENGEIFIALEYVKGRSLDEVFADAEEFTVQDAVNVFRQIARGLSAAHKAGVIHRNLKPSNVILTDKGLIKITDFGVARIGERIQQVTQVGKLFGSVGCMSPEQITDEPLDRRADIFSFGSLLYELATGQHPFQADNSAVILQKIAHESPKAPKEINPFLDEALSTIIMKMLERKPESRFQDMDQVDWMLAYYAEHGTLSPEVMNEISGPQETPGTAEAADGEKEEAIPLPEMERESLPEAPSSTSEISKPLEEIRAGEGAFDRAPAFYPEPRPSPRLLQYEEEAEGGREEERDEPESEARALAREMHERTERERLLELELLKIPLSSMRKGNTRIPRRFEKKTQKTSPHANDPENAPPRPRAKRGEKQGLQTRAVGGLDSKLDTFLAQYSKRVQRKKATAALTMVVVVAILLIAFAVAAWIFLPRYLPAIPFLDSLRKTMTQPNVIASLLRHYI